MAHPLPLTGERTLPGVRGEEYWFARHEAVYRWIVETYPARLADARVVEAGSGEGYGAAVLREAGARLVLALDYDAASISHAASTYPKVDSVRANLAALPVAAGSADVVVCLQVIEHLWDLRGFLAEAAAVLRPGGLLVVSTPNRPVFSPGLERGARPTNPFHVEEFDAAQVQGLLEGAGLDQVEVHGVHHSTRLTSWEQRAGMSLVAAQVAAVTGSRLVPHDLEAFVATVTVEDFRVDVSHDAEDLLATAVRR